MPACAWWRSPPAAPPPPGERDTGRTPASTRRRRHAAAPPHAARASSLPAPAPSRSNKGVVKALSRAALKFKDQPIYFSLLDATKFRQAAAPPSHLASPPHEAVVASRRSGPHLRLGRLSARRAFAADVGVSPSDLPTVVALSARRLRAAALPEALPPQAQAGAGVVADFVEGVLGGKVRTQALDVSGAVVRAWAQLRLRRGRRSVRLAWGGGVRRPTGVRCLPPRRRSRVWKKAARRRRAAGRLRRLGRRRRRVRTRQCWRRSLTSARS